MTLDKKIELIEELNRYRKEFSDRNPFDSSKFNAEDYIIMREVYAFSKYKEERNKDEK